MGWIWEKRGDAEYTPPVMSTIYAGWDVSRKKSELANDGLSIPDNTEVFVRELVQNFVDASREDFAPQVKPKLVFRFVRLQGEEASDLIKKLSISDISGHYSSLSTSVQNSMRMSSSDIVSGEHQTVRLLVATETGTSGMYGQWERSEYATDDLGRPIKNKMRDALISHVRDAASAGKGLGSFGEGKKAVIGISAARTLLTYTCFQPESSSDDVYSRFLGSTYWENHISENLKFTGLALFGDSSDGVSRPKPFVDAEADDMAAGLSIPGLESRKAGGSLSTGTTMVFFEPKATAENIARSIARNWWPLIEEDGADFEIYDELGNLVPIEMGESLQPFIDCYRQKDTEFVAHWDAAPGPAYLAQDVKTDLAPNSGRLVLGIDLRPGIGFSMANPDRNWSLVALIRDGMIIAYQAVPKSARDHIPFVRGIFEVKSDVHPESAESLRKIEPPLHNQWSETSTELDGATVKHSRGVMAEIKSGVEKFRKEHMSKLPEMDQDLPIFRDLLGIKGGQTRVVPPPPPPLSKSPVELLNSSTSIEPGAKTGSRFATSIRLVRLKKEADLETVDVSISLGWEVLEDGTWKDATKPLFGKVSRFPEEFDQKPGQPNVFIGTLSKSDFTFEWTCQEYSEPWTLRPYMSVSSITEEGE